MKFLDSVIFRANNISWPKNLFLSNPQLNFPKQLINQLEVYHNDADTIIRKYFTVEKNSEPFTVNFDKVWLSVMNVILLCYMYQ